VSESGHEMHGRDASFAIAGSRKSVSVVRAGQQPPARRHAGRGRGALNCQ
jgi:hypothetical protein